MIRSTDDGTTWQNCAAVAGAEKLDFRGLQAWDSKVAIVMSVGTGGDSRIYRTTDSCRSWKLVFTNPDEKGFWDALHRVGKKAVYIFGDPVDGKFTLFMSADSGQTWTRRTDAGLEAGPGSGAFAASNTSFTSLGPVMYFGGKGVPSAKIYFNDSGSGRGARRQGYAQRWESVELAMATGTPASGVFSIAAKTTRKESAGMKTILIAVGGAHNKPAETTGTAAFSLARGRTWSPAEVPPHGYRSCVAYDTPSGAWITVGPNGTDVSEDDGRTWRPLGTDPAISDNWNALSLPFAVGPKGRIGKLKREMLTR